MAEFTHLKSCGAQDETEKISRMSDPGNETIDDASIQELCSQRSPRGSGSTDRAKKSGIAAEAQEKVFSKYDPERAKEILEWIAGITGEGFETSGDVENFVRVLHNGAILCRLANELEMGAVKKINVSKFAFNEMENVAFFLQFAKKYVSSTELFQTVDLYESQDPNAVLTCLSALSRKSLKVFGKPGIGPKESEAEKRNWTEEQLRSGQAIIGLQMGSNKGASQSGMIIGNTRHM